MVAFLKWVPRPWQEPPAGADEAATVAAQVNAGADGCGGVYDARGHLQPYRHVAVRVTAHAPLLHVVTAPIPRRGYGDGEQAGAVRGMDGGWLVGVGGDVAEECVEIVEHVARLGSRSFEGK